LSYSAFIFDFDYTLGDSTKGIVDSMNYAFKAMGLPVHSTQEIRKTIGMTMTNAFKTLTENDNAGLSAKFYSLFMEKADELMTANTVLFTDTIPVLTRIKSGGQKTGIVTTKSHYRIDAILDKYGICSLVDVTVGVDDVKNAKPDPEALFRAIQMLKVNSKDVLYIGDSLIDAEAAKNAHVDFFAVTTGTTSKDQFSPYPNIAVAGYLSELIERHII
jgi:phosphoglycolate phosphatase